MPFNDGLALSFGGKVGRGIILSSEGSAVVASKRRSAITTLASGLTDNFQPLNSSANVSNEMVLTMPAFRYAESFIEGTIKPQVWQASDHLLASPPATIVENWNGVHDIRPATAFVSEPNKRYIIPYLSYRYYGLPAASAFVMENRIYKVNMQTEIAVSRRNTPPIKFNEQFKGRSATVFGSTEDKFKINYAEAFVTDMVPQMINTTTKIKTATAVIEDYKPPAWGSVGSGSGLKSARIIAQKGSFFEMYLSFDDCTVTSATGLPEGMVLEGSYIKGSPALSGKYPVTLKLSNERSVDAYIIVPEVPRQL